MGGRIRRMAKRTGGGEVGGEELRRLLVAAVVEYGTRKLIGPYALALPRPTALKRPLSQKILRHHGRFEARVAPT